MTPIDWAMTPLRKYADFSGRAPRAEFWWYTLAVIIASVVAMIVESMLGLSRMFLLYGPLTLIILLGTMVPSVAVQVRRLHDTNKPGWWLLAFWLPYVGYIWSMRGVMAASANYDPTNPDPAAVEAMAAQSAGSLVTGGILGLVVLVMAIVLIVFFVKKGTEGPNNYGPDPYGA